MADVVRWVDAQEVGEVMDLLEQAGSPEALQAAQANWLREERQRSSVYTTAESVLDLWQQRKTVKGLKMVYEPKYLRFFRARFERL
jgi:tryptophanase